MVEGVAEYREPGKDPYRLLIHENAIKNMDPTFQGRPVYVDHVAEVDFDKMQEEADGYVVDSFFNKSDGKHWAKFIVVTEKGKEAIRNGWKLSNAYIIKDKDSGGTWHGVDYMYEVTRGEYEHLAIVQNPRYAESVIMSPEDFKEYNKNKEAEIQRLQNSLNEKETVMFFKKEKVANAKDLEQMSVTLPKSGKEVTILRLVNEADEAAVKENEEVKEEGPVMANGDHMVKVGEEEMSVNTLVEKHLEMSAAKNSDTEKKEDEAKNEAAPEKEEAKKENTEAVEEKKKENTETEEEKEEKKANAMHFEALKNAEEAVQNSTSAPYELSFDRVARGKSRYGSK